MKTLKDLDKEWCLNYGKMLIPRINGENCLCKDLRQEAIKWFHSMKRNRKEFQKIMNKGKEVNRNFTYNEEDVIREFIQTFFNITHKEIYPKLYNKKRKSGMK